MPRAEPVAAAGANADADSGASQRPAVIVWRRFARRRVALVSLAVLLLIALAAIFANVLGPYSQGEPHYDAVLEDPSAQYWLGTDTLGRDILSQVLYGGRVSLAVGLAVALIATSIGTLIGMFAGYLGGWVDTVLMRITDFMLALPALMAIIMLARILGDSVLDVVLALSALGWMPLARIIRAKTMSLSEQEVVSAARAIGVPTRRILLRHLLPNLIGEISVAVSLAVAAAILAEAAISFLGLGISAVHTPTWGNMLSGNEGFMTIAPWLVVAPGLAIVVTVLAVNFVGDGLRDAFDVRNDLSKPGEGRR